MNNDTTTIDEFSIHPDLTAPLEWVGCADTDLQQCVEDELRWTCLEVLALCEKQPPAAAMSSARQMILYLTNTYDGIHAARFAKLCRGLHLMAEHRFREALGELSTVLIGRVDPRFELFRELALHAHSFCLERLDYDEEALEEFTGLLVQKFAETRDHGQADHVARLLGLAQNGRDEQTRAVRSV